MRVQDLAEAPLLHPASQLQAPRVDAQFVVDQGDSIGVRPGRLEHRQAFVCVHRGRLLAHHVAARLERVHALVEVAVRRGDHEHQVRRGGLQDLAVIGAPATDAELLRRRLHPTRGGAGDSHHLGPLDVPERRQHHRTGEAVPEDRDPYRRHALLSILHRIQQILEHPTNTRRRRSSGRTPSCDPHSGNPVAAGVEAHHTPSRFV